MQAVWQIGKYIVQNNTLWQIPFKFLQAFQWQLEKRIRKSMRIKTLMNGKLSYLFPNTPSASCLVYADYPDKPALLALRQLADHNMVFLDIGANIGFYSLLLADKVKSVFAFEAHPDTVTLLRQNFSLNQIPLSYVIPKAVAETCQPIRFSNFKSGSPVNHRLNHGLNQAQEAITIDAITLDTFARDYALSAEDNYIVKLDVEGAEMQVLEGATQFLTRFNVRAILFEQLTPEDHQVAHQLETLGYRIQPIMKNNYLALKYLQ